MKPSFPSSRSCNAKSAATATSPHAKYLIDRLGAFIADYDQTARPFRWTYAADPVPDRRFNVALSGVEPRWLLHSASATDCPDLSLDPLPLAWSRNLAAGTVNGLVASPSNAVLTEGSRVRALDLASGEAGWTDDAGSQPPWQNPGVDNGEVTAVQGLVGATTTRFDEMTGARLGTTSDRIEARRGSRTP